jgi:predicted CopG family antitoxin
MDKVQYRTIRIRMEVYDNLMKYGEFGETLSALVSKMIHAYEGKKHDKKEITTIPGRKRYKDGLPKRIKP